jgi:hypothetical protein
VRRQLGGYVRDSLPAKARQRVDDHLDRCARCRAAVLDVIDVDAAIRLRVAPVLLPGAFAAAGALGADDTGGATEGSTPGPGPLAGAAAAGAATAPEPVLGVESILDDIEGLGADVGTTSSGSTVVGRVLSVPGRSAAAVVAAAAILVAALLFMLQSQPEGRVAADAPMARDSSSRTPGASEPGWPTSTAATATSTVSSVIGEATAEDVSLRQPQGARDSAGRPVGTAPQTTGPTGTAGATSTGTAPGSTSTGARSPGEVGAVTRLAFTPADQGTYLAHLEVPAGWLITSVRDRHGAREVEHVSSPTRVVEVRLRSGQLVVEVTRARAGVTGRLVASFEDRSGEPLAGSGSYPLL